MGRRYRTGEPAQVGDRVKISRRWAKEYHAEYGYVTELHGVATGRGLDGFLTVNLANGRIVDFDARAVIFCGKLKMGR